MLNRNSVILGMLLVVATAGGTYLAVTDPEISTFLDKGKVMVEQQQVCTGPITATCNWQTRYLPIGTDEDDYYVEIEMIDTESKSTVLGPVSVKYEAKTFSARFDVEEGKRYACKITTKMKEASSHSFCYSDPVFISEPTGLCID